MSATDHPGTAYQEFVGHLVRTGLIEWLPEDPQVVADLSWRGDLRGLISDLGHRLIDTAAVADLDATPPQTVDVVVAEDSALSHALATEVSVEGVQRVLRPGGRMLASFSSLLGGMSELADQQRWAELTDVPSADVVLVPSEDGSMRRCFSPEDLIAMFEAAGFAIDWIRPRTVLAADTVIHTLGADPSQMSRLVLTENELARDNEGRSIGTVLVVSAVRL